MFTSLFEKEGKYFTLYGGQTEKYLSSSMIARVGGWGGGGVFDV